jgi:hypothetical protein
MKRLVLWTCFAALACAAPNQRDAVPIPVAGVIEGFWGPPWSHDDRLAMLDFMGDVGLTDYVYAPKDDPYHRLRWRDPYPPDRLAQLGALVAAADDADVHFHFAISPGVSMAYSDTADYRILRDKLAAVAALGVSRFAFFVDDVPPNLDHDADRTRYDDLAAAHADIANRLAADLRAEGATLSVTPTTYTDAWGDPVYADRLGALLDPEIPLFWTGSDVVSATIDADEAARWEQRFGRKVLIWDNYPVNDFARWRPFLGPFDGRGAYLGSAIAGLIANPMNEAHASMLPLATLAAYARDPGTYDPAVAISDAAAMLYGPDAAPLVLTLVGVWGSYAHEPGPFETLFLPGHPIDSAAVATNLATATETLDALQPLTADRPRLAGLVADLEPLAARTAARWQEILDDPHYLARDGVVRYDPAIDRLPVPTATETPGDDDPALAWRPLTHPTARAPVRAALVAVGDTLHVVVDVPVRTGAVLSDLQIGDGDHIALVVQGDDVTDRQHVDPPDVVLLFPAPTGDATPAWRASVQDYTGMVAKYVADNRGMTYGEFHVGTFGVAASPAQTAGVRYATRRTRRGYRATIAVPVGASLPRVSLTVTTSEDGRRPTYGLASRNYPTNPATFVTLVAEDP